MVSTLDKALQALIKMQIKITKVWENASPISLFAAQTVNISGVTSETPLIIESISASESSMCEITSNIVFPENLIDNNILVPYKIYTIDFPNIS